MTNTASCKIKENMIDSSFVNDVRKVAALVRKIHCKQVLPTCTKWLNKFKNATQEEKHARNGLMSLMYLQLAEKNILTAPFTIERNLYLKLCTVYQNYANAGMPSIDSEICLKWTPIPSSETFSEGVCYYLHLEDENSHLAKQNIELKKEQKLLQFQLTQNQVKLKSLTKINEALWAENEMFINEIGYLKELLICSVLSALKLMNGTLPYLQTKPNFFQTLFGLFFSEDKYTNEIQQLDNRLWKVLNKSIGKYLELQKSFVVEQSSKDFDKLKSEIDEKYKKAMIVQNVAQNKLITLAEMRYLTVLRKIFVDTFFGEDQHRHTVVSMLEKKYAEAALRL